MITFEVSSGPVEILYTNWQGETAWRRVQPLRILWGSSKWHPEPQWLLQAIDTEKNAERDFAMKNIAAAQAT